LRSKEREGIPRHAEIACNFFDDGDFDGWAIPSIYLYLYYTISSNNITGIQTYRHDIDIVESRMKNDEAMFLTAKEEIEKAGKVVFEQLGSTLWRWVVGKANRIKGQKQVAHAFKVWSELPSGLIIKNQFWGKYNTLFIPYGYGIDGVSAQDAPIPISIPISKPIKKETTPSAVDLSTSSQQKEKPWDTLKRKWKEYFGEDISNKQIGKLVGKKGIYGFLFVEAIIQAVDECHKQVKENPYGFFLAIAKEGARVEPFIRRAREKFKVQQDKIGYEDFQIPKREV